jgi:glutaredoxin-like YruB-family protein
MLFLLLAASTAGAEMYQWIDENGSVTFKDTPPPPSKKGARKVKVYKEGDFDPAPPVPTAPAGRADRQVTAAAPAKSPEKQRFSGTVEIYVTEWCGYCKQAQRYMNSKGIPFVAYDIEKDHAAKQRHKELGGRGVPLIIIGSNKMSGFSPDTLEYYLNSSR